MQDKLTEKDLHCIARHIQNYVKMILHKEKEVQEPCTLCKFAGKCGGNEHTFNPYEAFGKLSDITGVNIQAVKGFMV